MPDEVKKRLKFTLVDNVDEVLAAALERKAPVAAKVARLPGPKPPAGAPRRRLVARSPVVF